MEDSIDKDIATGINQSEEYQTHKCVVCSSPARYRLYDSEDYGGCFLEDHKQLKIDEDTRLDKSRFARVWPFTIHVKQEFCSAECMYAHIKELIKELDCSSPDSGYILKQNDKGWIR